MRQLAGTRPLAGERGAVAIEMVALLPILILLVFGIYEFGRSYSAKVTLTHAAREAVREYVISENDTDAITIGENAAQGLNSANLTITVDEGCGGEQDPDTATVTASYTLQFDIPLWDSGTIDLDESAVMRCAG